MCKDKYNNHHIHVLYKGEVHTIVVGPIVDMDALISAIKGISHEKI